MPRDLLSTARPTRNRLARDVRRRQRPAQLPPDRQEGQRYQMGGDRESDVDDTAGAHGGFAVGEVDLHVMMLEKGLVEWMDRLVNSLFGSEQQSPPQRIVANVYALFGCRDQIQQ